eukprot:gene32625-42257_t
MSISSAEPHFVQNLVQGTWTSSKEHIELPDPLTGESFIRVPNTSSEEAIVYINSLNTCSKSGLHNPLKANHRYVQYGSISAKAASLMGKPEVLDYFAKLIQRVAPKSYVQAIGEVKVCQKFLENFGGDQVLLKVDSRVSIVMEQCGLPREDVDFINCDGPVMHKLLLDAKILGPDVSNFDFVAYTSDQDAYAYSGQKCSAQSALFAHSNWLLFGGELLASKFEHKIPSCYGSWLPTAIQVPLEQFVKDEVFKVCTTEIFGPFQVQQQHIIAY